jgi:AraC family transcriptional regulator
VRDKRTSDESSGSSAKHTDFEKSRGEWSHQTGEGFQGRWICPERKNPFAGLKPPASLSRIVHALVHIYGYCAERNARRTQEYGPFDLQVAPAGQVHSIQYGRDGARSLNIEIESERTEIAPSLMAAASRADRGRDARVSGIAIQLYQEFQNLDSFSGLAIEGLVLEVLARAAQCSATGSRGRAPIWLGRARDLVHEHFNESLSLTFIAETIGVHPVYLARAFRRHYHCTIGEYTRRLRIDFASRELITSDTPLVEIGLAAGFCAQSHFSFAFKHHTGLSPGQYRSAFRSR